MLPTKIKTVFKVLSDPEFVPTGIFSLAVLGSSATLWAAFSEYLIDSSGSLLAVALSVFASLVIVGLSGMMLSGRVALGLFSIAAFLPAFWFAPPSIFVPTFLAPMIVLFLGLSRIREENASRIRLSVRRSLAWGAPLLVAAFSLAFALFYFFTVRTLPIDAVLPQISFGSKTGGLLTRALSFFNPDFHSADVGNLTVDEFLRATNSDAKLGGEQYSVSEQKDDSVYTGGMDPALLDHVREEAVLSAGRDRFSHLVGRTLSGNERIADILSEVVNRRLAAFSLEAEAYRNLVPSVLALLVFLTAYSTISFLSFLWTLSVRLLFSTFRALRLVRVVAVPADQETVRLASFGGMSNSQPTSEVTSSEISNQDE